jgi:hypothetical protein
MNLPLLILVIGFLASGLAANVAVWKMVAEVNARLAEANRFSWLWWTFGKYVRLWREHKRLCPHSHLRTFSILAFSSGALLMFLIAFLVPRVPK